MSVSFRSVESKTYLVGRDQWPRTLRVSEYLLGNLDPDIVQLEDGNLLITVANGRAHYADPEPVEGTQQTRWHLQSGEVDFVEESGYAGDREED